VQRFSGSLFVHYVRFLSVSADKCVGNLWFCFPLFGILAYEIMPIVQRLKSKNVYTATREGIFINKLICMKKVNCCYTMNPLLLLFALISEVCSNIIS
jgi:hypothetical protein